MKKSESRDSLGDRMKENYENRSQSSLPRNTYSIIRLDGKAFHTFTKGLQRPFDSQLMSDMDNTAKFLCEEVQGCKMAYVQSDEISLLLADFDTITTDAWFDGKVQKICSVSASLATAKFNQLRMILDSKLISKLDEPFGTRYTMLSNVPLNAKLAFFDSRVFTIPHIEEVVNYFVWRQQDATRNSIQMAAQFVFSHKELQGVNCNNLQEKLWKEKQINWNDYPVGFKRGRCVLKESYTVKATHEGCDPDQVLERTHWVVTEPPIFTSDREYIKSLLPKQ